MTKDFGKMRQERKRMIQLIDGRNIGEKFYFC